MKHGGIIMEEILSVERLQPLVNKIVSDNYINVTIDEDDLRQILWCKVQEVMPKMVQLSEYDKGRGFEWNDNDRFKWIKACLNNHVKDVKHGEAMTPGASQYSLMELDFSELMGGEVNSIFEKMSDYNQEDMMIAKELHGIIMDWTKKQSDNIKKLISERMQPSAEMEDAWEERLKVSPRCKNASQIPIWSMLKILGINEKEYYKKIRCELAEHLMQLGYTGHYLN